MRHGMCDLIRDSHLLLVAHACSDGISGLDLIAEIACTFEEWSEIFDRFLVSRLGHCLIVRSVLLTQINGAF